MIVPIEPCYNFHSNHPMWKGEPSYTCKGCTRWDRIEAENIKFICKNGTINCKNYSPQRAG